MSEIQPPHTTHILQGEDVVHFCVFKPAYHQQKLLVLAKKVTTGKYRLSVKDLLACAREPWETAFNLENTLKAWQKIGVQPFNRRVYWDLVAAKEKREKIASEVSIDPELLTVTGMVQEKTAKRKAAEEAAKNKKDARVAKRQQQAADANQLGSLVISALTHAGQLEQLKVGEIRGALAFKGVAAASNLLKAQLKQLLSDALQLPSEGPVPRFVLPALNVVAAAPAAPEPAHESDDSNDDITDESDEEEGEIVA
ncbi:hypothetical protein AB1Y20_006998 [Prymnesium parvum]|uniref:Uncharacterized protein n=1 Tax=Prymnesium parvum TaxID=97485 RepID=A0AB34J1Z3_PRYPA